MNNIRVRFIRGEEVKYISHLDLMKAVERAMRRSQLPIAYSQGFNPHPQMIFGLPLSVGVTSQAEYADFEIAGELPPEEFMERLNAQLPAGLKIVDAKIREGKGNIMASISAAAYDILAAAKPGKGPDEVREAIGRFILEPSIVVEKEGKKGKRQVDVKPMIMDIKFKAQGSRLSDMEPAESGPTVSDDSGKWLSNYINSLYSANRLQPSYGKEDIFCLSTLLSAGSVANLKPELLVEAFAGFTGWEIKLVKVHRTDLFIEKEGKLQRPLDKSVL